MENMKVNAEMLPQVVDNSLNAESSHPSHSQCPDNFTSNLSPSVRENGPLSKNVNTKATSSSKKTCLLNNRTRKVSAGDNAATLTVKCICGSTRSSIDDVLLKCTDCLAVSHASCLGHRFASQKTEAFLCPNCAVNRVRK